MIGSDVQEVKRKVIAILKILKDSKEPLGARVIAQNLVIHGVELGERAVRYHLKQMDEGGLTELVGRDGRIITKRGMEELKSALVRDKVGFAISRIELLAFRTNFDLDKGTGQVPVNISYFPEGLFFQSLRMMKPVFQKGLCVSDLVAIGRGGERFGEVIVPKGKIAFATVCSIIVNGSLLKAGVPMDSRFGGILEMRGYQPLRFVELIHYAGSSMDPSEIFIRAGMTSVTDVVKTGDGKILANYREIPSMCRPIVDEVTRKLKKYRLGGILLCGVASEPVCEIPVDLNRSGIVLVGGMNPVAAAVENGVYVENNAMSMLIDYEKLVKVDEIFSESATD
ncbi:MAG TPA: NrpR regulatory domain-containing protein [Dehalococcoidales bacterium]|nr:NrpR regulatory domain-containing protein [Dehalococcoidales bacterium]